MLKNAAIKMSEYFIKKEIIVSDEKEMYDFCFEILLSTIINAMGILIIGMSTKQYAETFIFALTFLLCRGVSGGVHAKTHLMCFVSLMMLFSVFVILEIFVPQNILYYISISISIVSLVVIIAMCPIDNINKPIGKLERTKLRKRMYIAVVLIITVITPLHCYQSLTNYAFSISYALLCIAILMILGVIVNKYQSRNSIDIKNNCENIPKST